MTQIAGQNMGSNTRLWTEKWEKGPYGSVLGWQSRVFYRGGLFELCREIQVCLKIRHGKPSRNVA